MVQSIKKRPKSKMKCIHHWDIDGDNVGKCRKCKRVKQFPNNNQIEEITQKLSHRNYLVAYGIPMSEFKELKDEILQGM